MHPLRHIPWKALLVIAGPLSLAAATFLPFTSAFELPNSELGSPILGWQMVCLAPIASSPFIVRDHPWILLQAPSLAIGVAVVAVSPLLLRGPGIFNFACAALVLPAIAAALSVDDYFVAPRLVGFYLFVASLVATFGAQVAIGLLKPDAD